MLGVLGMIDVTMVIIGGYATFVSKFDYPHCSRGFVTKPPRRQARQARGAVRRGNTPPGSSEGGVPPSWGFYKGAGPLVGVGEAGFRAEPAREGSILEIVC